ncbi:hypothetical protein [Desulforhabdus sp. TSK]|uniref:hypothetical protein n=1 Tax=Desulforhabdus sp. TSK TaxID=2925014 RepID=UPI001FC881C4|nr:hypothetical protein [Desulforhabdus sp. TSK]
MGPLFFADFDKVLSVNSEQQPRKGTTGLYMQSKYIRNLILLAALLLSLATLLSCKALTSQRTEENLKKRSAEYWDLKLKQQFEKAFAYELPDSVKDVTLSIYLTSIGRGVEWLGAEPESVSMEGDKGTVTMKIRYRWTFTQDQPQEGMIGRHTEEWRFYDGKWYHVYTGRRGETQDPKASPGTGEKSEKPNTPLAPKTEPPQPAEPKAAAPEEAGQQKTLENAGKPAASPVPQSEAGTDGKETNPPVPSEKPEKQDQESKKP